MANQAAVSGAVASRGPSTAGRAFQCVFALLCGGVLLFGCGCPPSEPLPPVDFIAVSPAEFRSPRSGVLTAPPTPTPAAALAAQDAQAHGWPLPLDAAGRSALVLFLAAGGQNTNVEDSVIQNPDAEATFGPLLGELQKPQEFKASLDRGVYERWFTERPIHQVIDAREAQILSSSCLPYAFRASGFVWIFKCDASGKLGELIVQKGLVRRQEL